MAARPRPRRLGGCPFLVVDDVLLGAFRREGQLDDLAHHGAELAQQRPLLYGIPYRAQISRISGAISA
ncbi:hypothetical protein I553_2740 [Mycobacterium xenopi 4042]|uniref:Uncharacterized protein n=1 Tax=Mycobacterium xenopi 4042 TaxID=1299334 RepID=X7YTK9_MYCXE|nr:hypothetical protein I553_2740 [Mycobacterium xenopi 4042]